MDSTPSAQPALLSAKAARNFNQHTLQLVHRLESLLGSHLISEKNKEAIAVVLYDTVKVLACREQRLNKPQLKPKEVAGALRLIQFYHTAILDFEAVGPLAKNLGACAEQDAVRCYNADVMPQARDYLGRNIIIPASVLSQK